MSPDIESTYEIVREIGSGGGGIVYLARHKRLSKWVVLKADKRPLSTSPEKLRREADMLKNLSQTYIPQVYDFIVDEEGGKAYTVIDYIEGKSLKELQEEGYRFPQPLVIKWACQLLEALSYLHKHEENGEPHCILHGDIKPANIMLTPQGDIRLIDFNIALDLGDESAVWVRGSSRGYASPEQYGSVDTPGFHTPGFQQTHTVSHYPVSGSETYVPDSEADSNTYAGPMRIMDARSDIYSLGATLYRLLSGRRPADFPEDVKPLSKEEASPAVAAIVSKAMSRERKDRYQSADEMLRAFKDIYPNDPRMKRHRRRIVISVVLSVLLILAGGVLTFTGQEQIKRLENARKLAGYSADALRAGDVGGAVSYALEALPKERGIFDPSYTPEAQRALANALGVYDLSDGYKAYRSIALPAAPIKTSLSPDGGKAAVLVQEESVWKFLIYDTADGKQLAALPAEHSALSDFAFPDNNTLLYAGKDGLCAYDFAAGTERRSDGTRVTALSLSGDGRTAATVYRDETRAVIWDADTLSLRGTVDFGEKRMKVLPNDVFADPKDNLFVLDESGQWLAVSFANGGLWVFHTEDSERNLILLEESDYTHFEGGFYDNCFAFCANGPEECYFTVIDLEALAPTGWFSMPRPFHLRTDESGVYLSSERTLVKIDPRTGDQTEAAYTESDIVSFTHTPEQTLVLTQNRDCLIFDANARLIAEPDREARTDFASLAGGYVLTANRDSPALQIHQWERHPEAQIFSYDGAYPHNEARLSADRASVMLFQYDRFRISGANKQVIYEMDIPDGLQVRKQLYHRDGTEEFLEVGYNDGLTRRYAAKTGTILSEEQEPVPDDDLSEEFETEDYLIRSPVHGAPIVYRKADGKAIGTLEEEAYLTYVTQTGDRIVAEYITSELERYGRLLDADCKTLADLPNLCDILPDGTLIFDDMRGNLRESRIWSIEELMDRAEQEYGR